MVLGVVFIVAFVKSRSPLRSIFGASKSVVNTAPRARRFGSIAVLPLERLSNDPSQEYFADGMTDELIADLAQLGSMRVISRTSVMQYKGTNKTVPQIGQELGVDALVEGSVERVGDRVRIRVRLIDTASDRHLWAHSYDHELKDLLLLESTAARDIAAEIQGQLAEPPDNSHSVYKHTVQPEAYESYLKGRYFWNQRSEAGLKKSIDYFQDAIAKDPAFAAAYAGLAGSYSILGSDLLPPAIARPNARAAATKALELDPTSAEGHAEMGLVEFYYDWNWKQAEQEYQRAIELNPSYAPAHQWYSYYLRAMGRLPEALEEARRAQQLDPLSLPVNATLAGRYRDLREYDQAIGVIQRTLELNPNFALAHEVLASVYEQQGNLQSAIGELQKAVELSQDDPSFLAALGHAYAVSGDQAEARKIAERLNPISQKNYVSAWDMAVLFTGLSDADSAFRWLEKSYRDRDSQIPFLKQDHRLSPLRADPRFQNLLRRVGLPT
jgi:TolB-like protein/Flp pilus assembly protein TadD